MAATYNKFEDFVEQLAKGVHQCHAAGHTFKLALTNTAPVSTNTILANITQISGTNGYTTGGTDVQNDLAETSGTATCSGVTIVWTATGGTIGPFRYVVLYNDTAASPADALIGWWDYGSSITLQSGDTFAATVTNLFAIT